MRFLLAVIVASGVVISFSTGSSKADGLTCTVNARTGSSVAARRVPNAGAIRTSVPFGTEIDEITFAEDANGVPWVLIGVPGDPFLSYGWVDRRSITCNWAG